MSNNLRRLAQARFDEVRIHGYCASVHMNGKLYRDNRQQDAERMMAAADRIDRLEAALRWQPIETAPKEGAIIVWAPGREGLQPITSLCIWHEQAGFCIDELRSPTHWMPLPEPPV